MQYQYEPNKTPMQYLFNICVVVVCSANCTTPSKHQCANVVPMQYQCNAMNSARILRAWSAGKGGTPLRGDTTGQTTRRRPPTAGSRGRLARRGGGAPRTGDGPEGGEHELRLPRNEHGGDDDIAHVELNGHGRRRGA